MTNHLMKISCNKFSCPFVFLLDTNLPTCTFRSKNHNSIVTLSLPVEWIELTAAFNSLNENQRCFVKPVSTPEFPLVPFHKGVKVDFVEQTIDYFIHSKPFNDAMEQSRWKSIEEVCVLIEKFDEMEKCLGINNTTIGLVARSTITGDTIEATHHSSK